LERQLSKFAHRATNLRFITDLKQDLKKLASLCKPKQSTGLKQWGQIISRTRESIDGQITSSLAVDEKLSSSLLCIQHEKIIEAVFHR
jgi:hypothetical protein